VIESRTAKRINVIQWATGGVGKAAIENVLNHPELELVGCWVHSAEKDGRDVGEILGREPLGVTATCNVDALLALDADCVMYSPLTANEDEVKAILRSGKNVVTPVGWVYPDRTNSRVKAVEAACLEGAATLHGSGIHPGGITERFPLMISSLSSAITHVRAEEFSDIRTYNAPDVVHHIMGFGAAPEDAMRGPMARLLESGFKSSVRMVADYMGFRCDPAIKSTQEVAVATATIDTDVVKIEAGTVAARRFRWDALADGEPVITAAVNWLMGEADLEPNWSFGDLGERFEVAITGDPDVHLTFKGLQPESVAQGLIRNPGIVATANHCVNAIPYVCAAEPGIKTYLELPIIAGRPAPGLSVARANPVA
jgi:2,4-diaminopentanoate dehydrogenase